MIKRGKKYQNAVKLVQEKQVNSIESALEVLKNTSYVNFDESMDIDINLGIDPSKGEQVVRGSVVLPHGRGKQVKVLVFAKGDQAEEAKKAGADYVGDADLIEKISKEGWIDFDYTVATPDLMGAVGTLAKILGPRGLLPNKKLGTVTLDVAAAVNDLKKGRVFFKNDKGGVVHFSFGKKSFDIDKLRENLHAFIRALSAVKPASAKGKYLKKVTLTSTMGVGIPVNPDDLLRLV